MKSCFLFLPGVLCLAVQVSASDPAAIAQQTNDWRRGHEREILQEFCDLLAIPNLASDGANIRRNAAMIKAILEKRGLTTQLLTWSAPPIVVGDLSAPGAGGRLLFMPITMGSRSIRRSGKAIRGNR